MTNQSVSDPTASSDPTGEFRKLPAVDTLLRTPALLLLAAEYGQGAVTAATRSVLADVRKDIAAGAHAPNEASWPALIDARLADTFQPSLRPVINATGVIVHTNLGRAPLSAAAHRAINAVGRGYSNLEYDLDAGARGSRHDHARDLLCELSGAEDALIVNNNAAAVYFVLSAFCRDKEVIISRSELVEIGGGFRIPDVLRQSGARLVEVGTTNRTHLRDYAAGRTESTAAIMRVHSSNFRLIGFVSQPDLAELAGLTAETVVGNQRVLLIDDLGSGSFLDTAAYGLTPEPMVQQSVANGADLITFSGDKLLGGPQAGIIVGLKELIAALRRHPLARALRVDKMTLAALEATLHSYRRGRATAEIPVWRMISAHADAIRERAELWCATLAAAGIVGEVIGGQSAVGGGSLPGETLPTWLLALSVTAPDAVAARLRSAITPIVCRIQQDRLLLDPRTVSIDDEETLLAVLTAVLSAENGD